MPDAAPTPAAERQRRHRARRKRGAFMAQVEVTGEMITALVDQGDVDEANSSNLDRVGEAIVAATRRYSRTCPQSPSRRRVGPACDG